MSNIQLDMKRDMEIVRKILLETEKLAPFTDPDRVPKLKIEGYHPNVISYHIKIMAEKGLISASIMVDDLSFIPTELTWEGHDFLDLIRDDNRWSKVKTTMNGIGGFAYEVTKSVAINLMEKQALGLLS